MQDAVEAEDGDASQTGVAPPQGSASDGISQPPPPPTAAERPSTPPRGAVDTSPGSGQPQVGSPGSGARSPATSWQSRSPGTPGSIAQQLGRPYNPREDAIEKFVDRTMRMAQVLERLGRPWSYFTPKRGSSSCDMRPRRIVWKIKMLDFKKICIPILGNRWYASSVRAGSGSGECVVSQRPSPSRAEK